MLRPVPVFATADIASNLIAVSFHTVQSYLISCISGSILLVDSCSLPKNIKYASTLLREFPTLGEGQEAIQRHRLPSKTVDDAPIDTSDQPLAVSRHVIYIKPCGNMNANRSRRISRQLCSCLLCAWQCDWCACR